ncbi:MAG TPA: hypothetical protein VN240_04710, partial [Propylenella sp.]|nr:hypothetical protein [Propylenella sp.]
MAAPKGRRLFPFMVLAGPGQTAGQCWDRQFRRGSALNGHKVDRREFPSSVDLEVELESIALADPRQAGTLNRADVHESIFLAIVAGNEAEALHRVEELHRSGGFLTGQLTLRAGGFLFDLDHIADDLEIRRRYLPAAVDEIERQLLPLGQALEPGPLNLADVDEHVLASFIALDEAEAFLRVEEFDLALAGPDHLRRHPAAARRTAAAGATATATEAAAIAGIAAPETIAAARAPVIASQTRRAIVHER